MTAIALRRAASIPRTVYALLALALAGAIAFELARTGAGWWQLVAFGAGPDLALFLGVGAGLAKGQLHPRAVPLYNAVHRFWGPVALLAVSFVLPAGYLVAALAWGFHVALDRTVGYGLRTRDGFQRD